MELEEPFETIKSAQNKLPADMETPLSYAAYSGETSSAEG